MLGVPIVGWIGLGGALDPASLYGFTALAWILNFGSDFFSDRINLTPRASKVFREVL